MEDVARRIAYGLAAGVLAAMRVVFGAGFGLARRRLRRGT